jgi:hypothetical protein
MLLSVANSRPRNLESSRVSSLFPDTVQESSKTLIEFVEKYYEYLNVVGLPSSEIANITSAKDIDVVSNKYLTEIQSLIARNIPNSVALDKVTLYKIILQYYRTRGSEDSIHSFFKIFFDEFVTIFYPRDYLFELSGGRGQWMPIVASQLATVNTNPNKNQIKIVSDAIIGPVTSNDKAPYTFILQSYSKFVWTLDGRAPSSTVPHLQKVNSRWVYTYGNDVVVTSANNTTWPDEALWNTFSRNIEYTSGNAGSNTTRNIEYKTLEITPVGETTETILLKRDDTTDILATESGDELTLEQFFTPEGTIDIVVSGITTENNLDPNTSTDYIIVQDTSITNTDDAVIVTEDAGSSVYTAITSNIEYVHLFTVTALPLNALKIDDLINSLETAGTNTVYRCTQISPTIWESVTTDFRIWQYSDSKSFASDRYKLHDGEFWQKYSYQIKTTLSYDTWSYDYLRFVHPTGLKLFTALLYELLAKSEWKQYIDYISSDSTTDYTWLGAYIPPVIGYHTPTSQPGWLTSRERVLKFLLQVLRDANADESLIRIIELVLSFESLNEVYRDKIVHNTYQSWFKFIDTTELIAGFSDKTIALANAEYSREDLPLFSNLSCIVTPKVVDFTYYPWTYSQLISLDNTSQSIDPNYALSDVNVFDVDFEPYINSEILPSEELSLYSYLQTENNNYSITEDGQFGFATEGPLNIAFNTYAISSPTDIVTPNGVTFNVVTTGVFDGTRLYYTTRFPTALQVTNGVVTIANNSASFTVQINEGINSNFPIQAFNIDLRLDSVTGPIVATSNLVIIFP